MNGIQIGTIFISTPIRTEPNLIFSKRVEQNRINFLLHCNIIKDENEYQENNWRQLRELAFKSEVYKNHFKL
jgi:hypothetical protein